jgi:hypothetical protein
VSDEVPAGDAFNYVLSFALVGPAVAALLYMSAALVSGDAGLMPRSGGALLANVTIIYAIAAGPLALAGLTVIAQRRKPRATRLGGAAITAGGATAGLAALIGFGPAALLLGLAAAAGALVCLRIVRRPWTSDGPLDQG